MIGIQNADGTITWVLAMGEGARGSANLSPVRHGQTKFEVTFFYKNASGQRFKIGFLTFRAKFEGFLETPEFPVRLRIDGTNKLHITLELEDKVIQKRFVIPGNVKQTKPKVSMTDALQRPQKPRNSPWVLPKSLASVSLFGLGLVLWALAIYVAMAKGIFT